MIIVLLQSTYFRELIFSTITVASELIHDIFYFQFVSQIFVDMIVIALNYFVQSVLAHRIPHVIFNKFHCIEWPFRHSIWGGNIMHAWLSPVVKPQQFGNKIPIRAGNFSPSKLWCLRVREMSLQWIPGPEWYHNILDVIDGEGVGIIH